MSYNARRDSARGALRVVEPRTLDTTDLARRLPDLLTIWLAVDAAAVWLSDDERGEILLRGHVGLARPEMVARAQDDDLIASIASARVPVVLPDLSAPVPTRSAAWLTAEGFRGLLGAPLVLDGACRGIIAGFRRTAGAFSPTELSLAEGSPAPRFSPCATRACMSDSNTAVRSSNGGSAVVNRVRSRTGARPGWTGEVLAIFETYPIRTLLVRWRTPEGSWVLEKEREEDLLPASQT